MLYVRYILFSLLNLLVFSACVTGAGENKQKFANDGDAKVETGEAQPKPEAVAVDSPAANIVADSKAAVGSNTSDKTRYVSSSSLWVRKGPGSKFATVRALKRGDAVEVLDVKQVWAKIGTDEFVSEKYLSAKAPGP